jgi:glycerol-3-phosphate dehydrogenase
MAQVAYAVESEHARTLGDVLLRRLPAGWSACHAFDGIEGIAVVAAGRLGWEPERTRHEIDAYRAELRRTLVPPGDLHD